MILQESLWPGMTRQGFAHQSRVSVRSGDQALYPVTESGLWLPTTDVSVKSYEAALRLSDRLESYAPAFADSLAVTALRAVAIDDETGCWHVEGLSDDERVDALWDIAELDMRGRPLDGKATKAVLQICERQDCMNARHYDFTHQVKNRDKLLMPDMNHYHTRRDGTVVPVWELSEGSDIVLPSVEQSMADLRALQLRCLPFIDESKLAPLTANAISKITIHPVTGCWMTRTYYNRPDDFDRGFMFDGYGRLGFGPSRKADGQPEGRFVAHRVLWDVFGRTLERGKVLNHECGFHPCCYPKHLTQMTTGENNAHARRMNAFLASGSIET